MFFEELVGLFGMPVLLHMRLLTCCWALLCSCLGSCCFFSWFVLWFDCSLDEFDLRFCVPIFYCLYYLVSELCFRFSSMKGHRCSDGLV